MLQYLVILLDDTSVAYCHADNPLTERRLMPIETLRKAILFGMKENLMIQYVLPDYALPEEYQEVMERIDNVKIYSREGLLSQGISSEAQECFRSTTDVLVYDDVPEKIEAQNIVIRMPFEGLMAKKYDIGILLTQANVRRANGTSLRINLVITDIEKFDDKQIEDYKKTLGEWVKIVKEGNLSLLQVNILTDRLQLDKMHNCDAGVNNITVAPNGRFYLCPAFYYDEMAGVNNRMNHHKPQHDYSVGDLDAGLQIPNQQLLKLDHAPLCRICDAYHCKRCVWLNQKLTWDANTPSHQQCVLAHLERNASRELQQALLGTRSSSPAINEIKEINYLDPFDVREEF